MNKILSIIWLYNFSGDCTFIIVRRVNSSRVYKKNPMSDSQHNLTIMSSDRKKWIPSFYPRKIEVKRK